ncbi:MAG: hypothetical protein WAM42_24295 [Candidatus Nitrosopolaris sp.]
MHKHTSFAITATILLTAIVTVTLYTVNAANAQADNATNATGGAAKNMSGVAPRAEVSSCVKVGNHEAC